MENKAFIQGDRRELYKSMGEAQVARLFDRVGVKYLYEHPLAVVDDGKVRLWYPDFQLPGYGILIEYCGVKGNSDYDAGMRKKQAVYERNGLIALILTHDDFAGNWPERILGRIEKILAERLAEFRQRRGTSRAPREIAQVVKYG